MKQVTKTLGSTFRAALLLGLGLGLGSFGFARTAQASSNYPPALAAAIASQYPQAVKCVPLCTACHLTTQGGPANMNVFGQKGLEKVGGLLAGNPDLVPLALKQLAVTDPDSDGDGVHDIEELIAGDSPAIPGDAGKSQFCPDIRYGCGARIAAQPPVDRLSLFSAGLIGFWLAAARRRRGARRTHGLRR